MKTVKLVLYGDPVPKARARTWRDLTIRLILEFPCVTSHAENNWRDIFLQNSYAPFPPETPLELTVTCYFSRPKSAPKRRVRPTVAPDYDNIVKLVTDALQKLAFHNDSEVVDAHIHKHYAAYPDPPRTEVVITEAV